MQGLLRALAELSLDVETAVTERVAPLLFHAAPESSPQRLRRAYYESAARNVALLDALGSIRAEMSRRGVTPVAIKGADLALSLYPNVALRPMSDLDLWVDAKDSERAADALRTLGFRPGAPDMTEGLSHEIKHARVYVGGPREEIAVDLHWSLVGHHGDRRAPRLDWFRAHARDGRLDDTAHLLYLAAHMKLQHYDERVPLLWLCDFYLLSHRGGVDWDELFRAATDFGWTKALAATAEEARERLGAALPEPLDRLSAASASEGALPSRKYGPHRAWNELSTLSWSGRAALVRGYLFPSPSYLRWRYRPRPAWTWPLWYPLRWARLVKSAAAFVFGRRTARPLLEGAE